MKKFELVGPYLENMGDVLMCSAIIEKLAKKIDIVASSSLGDSKVLEELKLKTFRQNPQLREILWGISPFGPRLPVRGYRKQRRAALEKSIYKYIKIDGVLDCNGFRYGDQWGFDTSLIWRAGQYSLIRKKGGKVILFPQSFGPFKNQKLRKVTSKIVCSANIVFARDERSFNYLKGIAPSANIHLAGDFTNLFKPVDASIEKKWKNSIFIIPNRNLFRWSGKLGAQRYYQFLEYIVKYLYKKGEKIVFLLHEKKDFEVWQKLIKRLKFELPCLALDAIETKKVLGSAKAIISSRFHGVINGLSQGVPTIGTSWTHKFDEIYKEYDSHRLLLDDIDNLQKVENKLCFILNREKVSKWHENITSKIREKMNESELMWEKINNVLDEK